MFLLRSQTQPLFASLLALGLCCTPIHLAQAQVQVPLPVPKASVTNPLPALVPNALAPAPELIGITPPKQQAEKPLPLRQWKATFKELGVVNAMTLRGVEGEGSIGLGVRRDELIESARLRLTFTLSPALLPALSHLKVLINDELLQTFVLEKEKLGSPQTVELKIDPRYFTDYNRLRFQFIGHYTMDCEMPSHSSLWASISNESSLELSLRQLTSGNDLALLPGPFFDSRDNRTVVLPFVYGSHPSMGMLKAAGSIASWIGVLASFRGNHFPVLENRLPERHAVVFATNAHRPDFLKDLAPIEKPTLSMMNHPEVEGAKFLLVLGKDDAQVQMAADALVLGKAALSGQSIQVDSLEYPPPSKAYDAPRWLTTDRAVPLAELVQTPSDLQLSGATLNGVINVPARLAPDLFTWNAKGIPLDLTYRYTPNSVSDHGALNVSVNDLFVRSYPLHNYDAQEGGKSSLLLPLLDDSEAQKKADLRLPAFFVGGNNRLQFAFQIPQTDMGRCTPAQPTQLHAAIDPNSTIDLTGFRHYLAMPNLSAFGSSGFPFTRHADLSETSIILPNQPTPTDVEVYLTALGRMGSSTGYPGTRFKLLSSAQLDQAKGTDILLISQADRDGVLTRWGHQIPALIEAGKRSIQPLERTLGALSGFFGQDPSIQYSSSGGQTTLRGDGPLAAIVGFQSPLNEGRSVVGLTATDGVAMQLISESLNDTGKTNQMRGDLALLRADSVESFRIHPVYYAGNLPWWERIWFHLHTHPLWLASLGIVAGLLLTFMVYGALRVMARRRLKTHHE